MENRGMTKAFNDCLTVTKVIWNAKEARIAKTIQDEGCSLWRECLIVNWLLDYHTYQRTCQFRCHIYVEIIKLSWNMRDSNKLVVVFKDTLLDCKSPLPCKELPKLIAQYLSHSEEIIPYPPPWWFGVSPGIYSWGIGGNHNPSGLSACLTNLELLGSASYFLLCAVVKIGRRTLDNGSENKRTCQFSRTPK